MTTHPTKDHAQVAAEALLKDYYGSQWRNYFHEKMAPPPYELSEEMDESIDSLLEMYKDKKSRKVAYASRKLKKMFTHLPPVDQRKVGIALLEGNCTDSTYVCLRLVDYKKSAYTPWKISWHPAYAKAVELAWRRYHQFHCGRLMIQHLDEKVVRSYWEELSGDEYYLLLCLRFVCAPWFQLDEERLKRVADINEYLYVMSRTAQGVSSDEARELLYRWMAVFSFRDYPVNIDLYSFWSRVPDGLFVGRVGDGGYHVLNGWGVDAALFYLLMMGHQSEVEAFVHWGDQVTRSFRGKSSPAMSEAQKSELFCRTIVEEFPADLKYLTDLDAENYIYFIYPSHPFVTPRLSCPMWAADGYWEPLPSLESQDESDEDPSSNRECYEKMVERNPLVKDLFEALECTPLEDD